MRWDCSHNWILGPVNPLTVVVLTNTAFEGCNEAFREEARDAVYGAGQGRVRKF
jgi:hypothetical protein